jgi:hypothetical protein
VRITYEDVTLAGKCGVELSVGPERAHSGFIRLAGSNSRLQRSARNQALTRHPVSLHAPAERWRSAARREPGREEIEAALGQTSPPRLLHGLGASAWEFVAVAAKRNYDTRTGLEDTLTLPDGSCAENNAALVRAAVGIVSKGVAL